MIAFERSGKSEKSYNCASHGSHSAWLCRGNKHASISLKSVLPVHSVSNSLVNAQYAQEVESEPS